MSIYTQNGGVLTITLLILSLMLTLMLALNKLVLFQQRSSANSADLELAKNYARYAMLNAELVVFNYDNSNNMEDRAVNARINLIQSSAGASSTSSNCASNGWCYAALASFLPWQESIRSNSPPCNSYTANSSGKILLLDAAGAMPIVNTQDSRLCAQPRYMLELINPNFVGRVSSAINRGSLTQVNGSAITTYNGAVNNIPTARLYRITVRAFGKNGNTRVTLQEYVVIIANTNLRDIKDHSNMPSHQIIIVSQRWLNSD